VTSICASDHWAVIGEFERKLRQILVTAPGRPDITADELDRLDDICEDLHRMLCAG